MIYLKPEEGTLLDGAIIGSAPRGSNQGKMEQVRLMKRPTDDYSREATILNISIKGERLFEGRLLFKEIR